jgi:hypothetical protein
MDDVEPRARDIANLRIEVSTLSEQVSGASLPKALASIRCTVTMAAILVSVALLASSAIHACAAREVRDLRGRVERLEAREPNTPMR